MNSNQIDIVIPWVNPNDETWKKDFNYWKEKETGQKDACRYRDMGLFNYWFRCIEQNMPWIRYIFLILAYPSQIPNWLNINNPKLKIIYHEQFMPKSELPTFNSSVINCYIPFIDELSNDYILFNDDFFVVRPIKISDYICPDNLINNYKMMSIFTLKGSSPWYQNINNNFSLMSKLFKNSMHVFVDHGPIIFDKNLQLFIWHKLQTEITEALSNSRFRQDKNITDWMFLEAEVLMKKTINRNSSLVQYVNSSAARLIDKPIICFNDNEKLDEIGYTKFMNFIKSSLTNLCKNKSSFEI